MIAHSAEEVSKAADRLATGTLADFSRAMQALGRGDLEAAHARVDIVPVVANSRDEVGAWRRASMRCRTKSRAPRSACTAPATGSGRRARSHRDQ